MLARLIPISRVAEPLWRMIGQTRRLHAWSRDPGRRVALFSMLFSSVTSLASICAGRIYRQADHRTDESHLPQLSCFRRKPGRATTPRT